MLACLGTRFSRNWFADFLLSGRCGEGTDVDVKLPTREVLGDPETSPFGDEVVGDCLSLGEDCVDTDKGGECLEEPRGGKAWLIDGDVGVGGLDVEWYAAPASTKRLFCVELLCAKFPALSTKTSAPGP